MAVTASAHRSLELAGSPHLTGVHPSFSIAGEVAPRTRRFATVSAVWPSHWAWSTMSGIPMPDPVPRS